MLALSTIITNTLEKLELMITNESLTGLPSGFPNLDCLTLGWQTSDLIVLAGDTSMGKTSFALSTVNSIIEQGIGVAYFSLEMTSEQVTKRILTLSSNIPYQKLLKGTLEDYEFEFLHENIDRISNMPLFIDDTPEISILEIAKKCQDLKETHDIKLVVIDYLQLVSVGKLKAETREQEISLICRKLKTLAKTLDIAIILVSQLSRSLNSRYGSKRPQMSDLKGSGAIEQIADIVSFVYRPEYYQILEDEEGNSLKGIGEIIIAKHKNGPLDSIRLKWEGQYTRFSSLSDDTFTGLDDASFFDLASDQFSGETFSSKMRDYDDIDDVPF